MKKRAERKDEIDLNTVDAAQVFRRWVASRILGCPGSEMEIEEPSEPGSDDTAPKRPKRYSREFLLEAWAMYSWLAEQSPEKLADEVVRAVGIVLSGLEELAFQLPHLKERAPDHFKAVAPFFKGLDLILQRTGLEELGKFRALQSDEPGLVMQQAFSHAGQPAYAEYFMRRYFALERGEEEADRKEIGLIARLIQNACEGVEVLERLERQYPDTVAREAQYVDRWPVLRRKSDPAVMATPAGAALGKRYPLETKGIIHDARKNSMRAYLAPLVVWLTRYFSIDEPDEFKRRERAEKALRTRDIPYYLPFGDCPQEAVKVLVDADGVPALRKDTASLWAGKLVVPFIMATDAADLTQLKEPVLAAIWNQKRVKTRKGFQSRLLDAVRKELPRMACQQSPVV